VEPESAALSLLAPVEGFAASSARSENADTRKTTTAAVAIILDFNSIVASCTAGRHVRITTVAG
jgi:hypothetical protein